MGLQVPQFPICDDGPDLPVHALFHCPFAKSFWFASRFSLRTQLLPAEPVALLFSLCRILQCSDFTSFANHLWALWKCRCSHVFEGTQLSHRAVSGMAESYNRWSRITSSLMIPRPLKHIWQVGRDMAQNGVSYFVDGSFSSPNFGGWAFLFYHRDTMLKYGLQYGSSVSAMCSEISGMLMAARAAIEMGITRCSFFTDCLTLQQILDQRITPDSLHWQDFHAVLDLLNIFRSQPEFYCTFIPRDQNTVSHRLANYARINKVACIGFTFPLFYFNSEHVTVM
ncbi:hypothetical protein LUZ62_033193 [Rhynchospora pubera]|uniref:RNase H type-1 domain-containing protein n=1 Tax=Rhynchospora pubera TaxID=906938 RepID=A0AAV8HSJ2_9POAL|nr:hypothetical protein LUZ62_033193 [Rhynchospora pubera]